MSVRSAETGVPSGGPALPSPATVVTAIGGLYVAQSVIGGVTFGGLPAVLRAQGLALDQIALILLTVLPWSFKFLWAPAIERWRLPKDGPHRSRQVVGVFGAAAIGALVASALIGPTALGPLTAALVVAAFASSTIDIACDGYAVESLPPERRSWGNAAQVGGAYAGSALGGGGFLVLVDHFGWTPSTFAMAGLILALGLPFMINRDRRRAVRPDARRPSLRAALKRREVRIGLAMVSLYVLGQKWAMVMIPTYLVDTGLTLTTIGLLNGGLGMAVGLAGALGGGWIVRRFGASRVMMWSLAAQVAITAGFALTALAPKDFAYAAAALTLAESGVMALGFVALYSKLMGYASLDQAGVDFTLFQCADGVVSLIGWQLVGMFGERLGWAVCFGAAAGLGAVAALALPPLLRRADA